MPKGIYNRKLENIKRKFTTKEYCSEVSSIRPELEVLGEFLSVSKPVEHFCSLCNSVWNAQPRQVLSNKKCVHCDHNAKAYSEEEFIKKLSIKNPGFELVSGYKRIHKQETFRHAACGFEFTTSPDRILRYEIKCRRCNPPERKSNWSFKITNEHGTFDSKLEADAYYILIRYFSKDDIKRYYPYPGTTKMNCDFYISSLDLYIEVSSINKPWYLERILKKRQMVSNFYFAQNEHQLMLIKKISQSFKN